MLILLLNNNVLCYIKAKSAQMNKQGSARALLNRKRQIEIAKVGFTSILYILNIYMKNIEAH